MTMKNVVFGEVPPSGNAKNVIDRLLRDFAVAERIAPYFTGDGVCGHKVMDVKAAVDVLRKADMKGELSALNLNDFELGNKLKAVLRRYFHLNKAWKIEPDIRGENWVVRNWR